MARVIQGWGCGERTVEFSEGHIRNQGPKESSRRKAPKWIPLWLGEAGSQLGLVLPENKLSVIS